MRKLRNPPAGTCIKCGHSDHGSNACQVYSCKCRGVSQVIVRELLTAALILRNAVANFEVEPCNIEIESAECDCQGHECDCGEMVYCDCRNDNCDVTCDCEKTIRNKEADNAIKYLDFVLTKIKSNW